MAERRKPPKDFAEDKIVRDLVPDPGQPPPDAVVLRGFMGKSDRDGHRRLYFDESLSTWAEIPEDEILHVETTPEDESGTAIWVKRGAQLETRTVQSGTAPAEFLTGDIAQGFPAGGALAASEGKSIIGGFVCSLNFICKRTVGFGCEQTPDVPCRPVQTPDFVCPPVQTDFPCPDPVRTPDFPCDTFDPPCPQRTPDLPCQTPDFKCPPVQSPDFRCPPPPPPARTPDVPCLETPDLPCPPPVKTPELPCFRPTPNPDLCFKKE